MLLLLVVMWGIPFVYFARLCLLRMVYSAGLTGVDQKDTETAITVSANSCIEPSSPPGAKGGKARRTFVKLQQGRCKRGRGQFAHLPDGLELSDTYPPANNLLANDKQRTPACQAGMLLLLLYIFPHRTFV